MRNLLRLSVAAFLRRDAIPSLVACSRLVNAAAGNEIGKLPRGGGSNCKNSGNMKIPLQVHGTTSNPQFAPDVGGVAASMLKSELNCAGGTVPGTNTTGNPANVVNQLGGLLGGKKKP